MLKSFLTLSLIIFGLSINAQSVKELCGDYTRNLTNSAETEQLSLTADSKFTLTNGEEALTGSWTAKNQLVFLEFDIKEIEAYKKTLSVEKSGANYKLCYHSNPTATKKSKYFKRVKDKK